VKRGLKGARPVVSDAHEGLKAAIACVSGATWQRCRVRWAVHGLGRAAQAFLQPDAASARQTWRHMADQLRPRWPKLGAPMDEAEEDVLAYMAFPAAHRTKLHSVNPLERVNKEIKRRTDVVGIFPSEAAVVRLVGAVLLEINDEWATQNRHMQVEPMGERVPTIDGEASPADRTLIPTRAA
jgi:putative transposase